MSDETLSTSQEKRGFRYNAYYDDVPDQADLESLNVKPTLWRTLSRLIRPGWFLDNLRVGSLRVILPTFLQVWVLVFLVVIPRVGTWMGQANYLLQIVGFVSASGGLSVSINVIMSFACFFAFLIGWVFAVVAMAICGSIRGWPSLQQISQDLISEGLCTEANMSKCMLEQFYTGRYLDARCCVVYSFVLILAISLFGIITLKLPKMARVIYVCSCISLVINTAYTVSFPVFLPKTIGLSILKPTGIACAFKLLVSLTVFPFTSNYKYLSVATHVLKELTQISERNERFFQSMRPSHDEFSSFKNLSKDVQAGRVKLSAIDIFLQSTKYELSYGRFSSEDAFHCSSRIKSLLNTMSGYEYFYLLLQERKDTIQQVFLPRTDERSGPLQEASSQLKLFAAFNQTYEEVGRVEKSKLEHMFKKRYHDETNQELRSVKDLDLVADRIKENYSRFLTQLTTSLRVAQDWLTDANDYRIYSLLGSKKHIEAQKQHHAQLVSAEKDLRNCMIMVDDIQEELKMRMFEGIDGHEQVLSLISQSSLFLFLTKQASYQVLQLIGFFLKIDETRPKPQFVWSFALLDMIKMPRILPKFAYSANRTRVKERDPDELAPETPLQIMFWLISHTYKLMLDERYWFHIHSGILTNFCVMPFYFSGSSLWFQTHKLVWFPIMCAISTSQYSADSVYNFITKIFGSFVGAICGMVAWYISTGRGNGNSYGYAAVTAVLFFFICCYRHFSKHTTPVLGILISVTPTLVLGTSWTDGQYGALEAGVGWVVAVRRFLSVIAGLTVAFSTTFFPRVRSSKTALRKKLSTALEDLNEKQSRVCAFAMTRYENPDVHIKVENDAFSNDVRALLLRLAMIRAQMNGIKYEIPLTGTWPAGKYERLHGLIVSITQLYFLLYRLFDQVEDTQTWIPHMVNRAAWNSSEFMSQIVSLIFMSSEALRIKVAIPEITTATLSIRHMEVVSETWGTRTYSLNERLYRKKSVSSGEVRARGLKKLDFENLLSHDGRLNVVSLLITHLIYKQIDEAALVVKELVGEKYEYNLEMFEF